MKPSRHPDADGICRRSVLRAALASGLSILWREASACEFATSTLTIVHPWTRATAADAAVAIVCMSFQDIRQDDRLIGLQTPVAEAAEMGGPGARPGVDFALTTGETCALSEAGVHVRLTGLKHALQVGREYPLTLAFEQAGIVQARLSVDYARFR